MTKTTDEVKETDEFDKGVPENLPIPMTKAAHENLLVLQGHHLIKYKRRITIKALGTLIFEKATPAIL
jgi:hypothetical protein